MTNQRNKILQALIPAGLLLIAIATVEPLIWHPFEPGSWFRYVYAVGALPLLLCRLFTVRTGNDLRLRRLYRLESWSAIFFCVGTFFMFYPNGKMRDWLAFTLAGAAIQIFTSIMIPLRQRKLLNHKK